MCPRTGVPYPERVLCSLKNKIAMIEQKLGLKIEKINGVGPDPSGNVTIVSDDAALIIEEDATQHQVAIGLDRAELPSAAVASVNGKTGAVVLDGNEIETFEGSTLSVTEAIVTNVREINNAQGRINQEILDRRNADAALQNSINTLTASLPAEAAAAVAMDPTIRGLSGRMDDAEDDINNLEAADAQNVKINDINQYAVGLTGNQDDILGNKTFRGLTTLSMSRIAPTGGTGYTILYRFKNTTSTQTLLIIGGRTIAMAQVNAAGGYKGVLLSKSRDYVTPAWMWTVTDANTGEHYLVVHGLYSATMNVHVINSFRYGTVYPFLNDIEIINQSTPDPTSDSRWSSVTEITNYD